MTLLLSNLTGVGTSTNAIWLRTPSCLYRCMHAWILPSGFHEAMLPSSFTTPPAPPPSPSPPTGARSRRSVNRALWLIALALLVLSTWPLRGALLSGEIPGSGPDVVSTLWGMWWSSQAGLSSLLGGSSELANCPDGVRGAILAPSTALTYSVFDGLGIAIVSTSNGIMTESAARAAGQGGARSRSICAAAHAPWCGSPRWL